jgi:hypothetical protein
MSTNNGTSNGEAELHLDCPSPLTIALARARTGAVAIRLPSVKNRGDAGRPNQREQG